jgi:hypothetical protein
MALRERQEIGPLNRIAVDQLRQNGLKIRKSDQTGGEEARVEKRAFAHVKGKRKAIAIRGTIQEEVIEKNAALVRGRKYAEFDGEDDPIEMVVVFEMNLHLFARRKATVFIFNDEIGANLAPKRIDDWLERVLGNGINVRHQKQEILK